MVNALKFVEEANRGLLIQTRCPDCPDFVSWCAVTQLLETAPQKTVKPDVDIGCAPTIKVGTG